ILYREVRADICRFSRRNPNLRNRRTIIARQKDGLRTGGGKRVTRILKPNIGGGDRTTHRDCIRSVSSAEDCAGVGGCRQRRRPGHVCSPVVPCKICGGCVPSSICGIDGCAVVGVAAIPCEFSGGDGSSAQ